MSLKSIVDAMLAESTEQVDRAYRIIGAKPGPGVDLLIYPVQPLCGRWNITGLTVAGRNFVGKFWSGQVKSNRDLSQLKHEAADWGLKYRVEYPITSMEA